MRFILSWLGLFLRMILLQELKIELHCGLFSQKVFLINAVLQLCLFHFPDNAPFIWFSFLLKVLVLLSSDHSMPFQIMQYRGEEAEHKYFYGNRSAMSSSEPLMATVVLYLSDSARGGVMLFPESKVRGSTQRSVAITMYS